MDERRHSPLKLVLRTYFSRVFPSAVSIRGQMPGWSGHRSLCMLCRAWAMAYTASITNCTFPSCSYLESIPIRSWPEGKRRGEKKGDLEPNASLTSKDYSSAPPITPSLHFIQHVLIFPQELEWKRPRNIGDFWLCKFIQAEILWQMWQIKTFKRTLKRLGTAVKGHLYFNAIAPWCSSFMM